MLSKTEVNRITLHCMFVQKSIQNHTKKLTATGFFVFSKSHV